MSITLENNVFVVEVGDGANTRADRLLAQVARAGAETAQGLSEDARDLSQDWAESATEPGGVGTKSSKTWAGVAEGHTTDAQTAQTNAETAETGAETAQGLAEAAQAGAETAQGLAEVAQTGAEAARDATLMGKALFATTAAAIGYGVAGYASLVAGLSGTDGTFDLAFTGGTGSGAAGSFVVAGNELVSIIITAPGSYTVAPSFSFAASSGLTGASATAVLGRNVDVGEYFFTPSAVDVELFKLYVVEAGPVATFLKSYYVGINDENRVDADGHSGAFLDGDDRTLFAFGPDGHLSDSAAFAADVADALAIDQTLAGVESIPRHGVTFTATDWHVAAGKGQSNEVGTNSTALTTTQPFNHKMLSSPLFTALVPQVESSKETWGGGFCGGISDRFYKDRRPWDAAFSWDWIIDHGGLTGAALSAIAQGTAQYNVQIAHLTTIKSLANTAGKTVAVRFVPFLHQESDTDNSGVGARAAYAAGIIQLKDDFNTDAIAITGQTDRIPFFIIQMGLSYARLPLGAAKPDVMVAAVDAAETDPEMIVIAAGYAFDFHDDAHYDEWDQRMIGEIIAKAAYRYFVLGRNPSTVRPLTYTLINSTTVRVKFYVPVPPLRFDTDWVWPLDAGMGFSAKTSGGSNIPVDFVEIVSVDEVDVHFTSSIATGDLIGYAIKVGGIQVSGGKYSREPGRHKGARGCLRDSDRAISYYPGRDGKLMRLPNWCVAFEHTL